MSTRAILAMRNEDNTYSGVYLASGELKGVFGNLPSSDDDVRQLIVGGNIERLLRHDVVRGTSSTQDPYDPLTYDPDVYTASSLSDLHDAVNMSHVEHILVWDRGAWLVVRYLQDIWLEMLDRGLDH
jgi:hypothetical protein